MPQTFACAFADLGLLSRHFAVIVQMSRSGKLWITRPYSGILTLRQDSEWRDRAGFNGHPVLIPAVPY